MKIYDVLIVYKTYYLKLKPITSLISTEFMVKRSYTFSENKNWFVILIDYHRGIRRKVCCSHMGGLLPSLTKEIRSNPYYVPAAAFGIMEYILQLNSGDFGLRSLCLFLLYCFQPVDSFMSSLILTLVMGWMKFKDNRDVSTLNRGINVKILNLEMLLCIPW